MILDEILQNYSKHNYHNEIGIFLEISKETFYEMQKEDDRMVRIGNPDKNGELMPLFDRPVYVVDTDKFKWAWKKRS
ncbi:hypothetical protein [Acinetobacter seifertii]|uniref:hypothetical protein n=1 Tax=Acinetobacter seifertii TaxID=1530123 RepID=UPI003F525581